MFSLLSHRRTTKYVSALALLLLVSPYSHTAAAIQKNVNEFVQLVVRDGAPQATNRHPFKIKSRKLMQTLLKLRAAPASKRAFNTKDTAQIFSADVAERLGADLASALRRAQPNQDIMFQVIDVAPFLGKLLDKDVIINGRVFWRRARLNIIFGAIRHTPKKRWMLGRVVRIVDPPTLPTRNKAATLKYRIIAEPGISLAKTRSGATRADWVKINLSRIGGAVQADTGSAAATPALSLEARLKKLKALRDKNLISEQQYRKKARQILDEL